MAKGIKLKTKAEIELIRQSGKILKKAIKAVLQEVKPGVTTQHLDDIAQQVIRSHSAVPSFYNQLPGYRWALCTPVNEQAVHTAPSDYILKVGDLLSIDIGVLYQGYHSDYAVSLVVGQQPDIKTQKFLETGRQALNAGIKNLAVGQYLGKVSQAIQQTIEGAGYRILKNLTGHGIGRELHEDPHVFNFLDRPITKTLVLQAGMTLALEVIYSQSCEEIMHVDSDPYTIVARDYSLTACFEHTVALTDKGVEILT